MLTSKLRRLSLGFVGLATVSVFVACSGGDDSSPTSDGGTGGDAPSNADVVVAPEGGAGDDSLSAVDVVSPPDATDEGVVGDAGQGDDATDATVVGDAGQGTDAVTSDSTQADGAADAVGDSTNSIDSTMSGDDSTTSDATVGDDSGDAGSDTASSPDVVSTGDDATNDVTTGDASGSDAAADSSGAPDTAPVGDDASDDSTSTSDGSNDASDVAGPPLLAYTFNSDQQGWFVQSTSPAAPAALAAQSYANYSSTFGNPPGSFFAYAAFSDSGQKVTVGITFSPYEDFTGKTVSMDIFLAGGSQTFTYFYLFCQDDSWDWEDPGPQSFPPVPGGQWMHVTLNVSHPQGFKSPVFDTTQIRLLGVELDSGPGIGPGSITPVSVYIDNVIVQ
jgi:hypothetical protein